MKIEFILLLTFLSLTTISCFRFFPKNLTDNAFEEIEDVSIRLMYQHEIDSTIRTNYDITYDLPEKVCSKLETTNQIDTSRNLGVAIRFWSKIVMNEEGTFYGPFPKNGLLYKITDLNILISKNDTEKDITELLKGKPELTSFSWKKYDHKKLPLAWIRHNEGYKVPYFENIEIFIKSLNEDLQKIEEISNYDFLFWFEKEDINFHDFDPKYLKIRLVLSDTLGLEHKIISDSMKIETI